MDELTVKVSIDASEVVEKIEHITKEIEDLAKMPVKVTVCK